MKINSEKRTELLVLREKYKQQLVHRSQHTTREIISIVKTASVATGSVWAGFKLLSILTGRGKKTEKVVYRDGEGKKSKKSNFITDIGTSIFGSFFYEIKEFFMALLRQIVMDFLHEKLQKVNKKYQKDENN
jgi:hypothetical protein